LVRGLGRYTGDVLLPGMAHLVLVRSPLPHASITAIDVSAAREAPGVLDVLLPADVADVLMPPTPNPQRSVPARFPLVQGRVLMPGDPVVAVVAESVPMARDAADLVLVDYEPVPVVGDVEEAMSAPPLHGETNVAYDRSKGDRERFEALPGPIRISGVVDHPRISPLPLECRISVADWRPDGLTFYTATQGPQLLRNELAASFGLPASRVRVVTGFVGGGFGAKFDFAEEDYLTVIASRRLGRPVRWEETRREHLLVAGHGRSQRARYELVAGDDGVIQGLWVDWLVDLGCRHRYLPFMSITPKLGTGVYRIPVYGWRLRGVWTNRSPRGIYRGADRPEAILTIERAVDSLAAHLGIDPAETRKRNFIPPDAFPYEVPSGFTYDTGAYGRALETLLAKVDYPQLRVQQTEARTAGRLVGIGLAVYTEVCGFENWGAARVLVNRDGSVDAFVETLDQGQGHRTTFAQLVASRLGVAVKDVSVMQGDTAATPGGFGTSGSRSVAQGGSAVDAAAGQIAAKARRLAAHLLEAAGDDIELRDGLAGVRGTDVSIAWRDLAAAAHNGKVLNEEPGLEAEVHLRSGGHNFPFGVHLAVVEVDRETGSVRLVRMVAVDDAGVIINPMLANGQRHGGMAQGIGQALSEAIRYDADGNLATASLVDYLAPMSLQVPSFELAETCTPTPTNPLGAKGIGEAGAIGSTPAVVNAVCDAIGRQDLQIPLTADKVWAAISQRVGERDL